LAAGQVKVQAAVLGCIDCGADPDRDAERSDGQGEA